MNDSGNSLPASRKLEIRSLTGLRGVAAVFVVLYHYVAGRQFVGPVQNLLLHGYLAVDLFFVLSGFVMALSYRHMFAQRFSLNAYGKFLGRRLARVYPLYLAGTLCGFALVYAGWLPFRHSGSLGALLLQNVLMIQIWGLNASLDFPGWSISAEWAAYLLFPLLLVPAFSRRRSTAWTAGAFAVVILAVLSALPAAAAHKVPPDALLNLGEPEYGLAVYRCVAEFTLGLLTFRILGTAAGKALAGSTWASSALSGCILLLMCFPRTDLAIALLFPALILSLTSGAQPPERVLETAVVQFLGRISYSIYLVHGLFAVPVNLMAEVLARRGLPHTQTIAAAMGLVSTVLVSTGAYYAVELPGRNGMRRLLEGERGERPKAVAADLRPEPGEF